MSTQLDHEKLDVYQLELQFVAWSTELMVELVDRFSPSHQVCEGKTSYKTEDENEDENEDDGRTMSGKAPSE